MWLYKRWLSWAVPIALLGIALVLHLRSPEIIEDLRLQVFDTYQRLKPRTYVPVPVVIVDVDERSLRTLGQWPWPRNRMAQLLDKLRDAGAAVVGLDFIFAEPDRTSPENVLPTWGQTEDVMRLRRNLLSLLEHDAVFADAIRKSKTVTGFVLTQEAHERPPPRKFSLAITGSLPGGFLPVFRGALTNLEQLDDGAAGSGSFNLVRERDGVDRRLHLMFQLGEQVYPSFPAELLRVALNAKGYEIRTGSTLEREARGTALGIESIQIGALRVPTDEHGRIWIYYTRPDARRYLPAWKLFDESSPTVDLEGYVVLVGTSAAGLMDLRATPLHPATPGVEVHASIVEQVLLGEFLQRPGWAEAAELLYLLALAVVLILLLPRLRAFGCAFVGAACVAAAVGASWYAFAVHQWLFDPVLPSLAVLAVYLAGSAINFAQTEAERRQVRSAFAHYLAPSVIQQLMDNPKMLRLGGEKREITFLFTDIAGFTSLTESTDPEILVRLLNDYLDGTGRLVLQHGGTIDKIVGDALHVMFNAPSDQPDHADRAVQCALALDDYCQQFAADHQEKNIPMGQTRIGVNTGTTVVGNFGGAARFDYTAHGDAVNTAARLESVNKYLGTRICVSGTTRERSTHPWFRPVGALVLKGKSQSLEVFEPLRAESPEVANLREYESAYELLKAQNPCASRAFSELARCCPDDGLIRFHASRLAAGEHGNLIVMAEK